MKLWFLNRSVCIDNLVRFFQLRQFLKLRTKIKPNQTKKNINFFLRFNSTFHFPQTPLTLPICIEVWEPFVKNHILSQVLYFLVYTTVSTHQLINLPNKEQKEVQLLGTFSRFGYMSTKFIWIYPKTTALLCWWIHET